MSEHQYYEFRAVDRPLDRAAQEALRSISSRARITPTSFTNHYEWGDFNGDPATLMERWFDLHLYLANWGTRRLMMRLPARLLDREALKPFLAKVDCVEVWAAGDNLIVDIDAAEIEGDDWDDDSDWLAAIAPLREDVLSGDLRLFYLLWLTAVQHELITDEVEPLPGIGPLNGPLEAFAAFFGVESDLLQAAAERVFDNGAGSADDLRETLAAIPDQEKIDLLMRVVDGDSSVTAELRRRSRRAGMAVTPSRTARDLRLRAEEIAKKRARADAERRAAILRRQAEQAAKDQRERLAVLRQRGESAWREVEDEIERRNAPGYNRAASLLFDLHALAAEEGGQGKFSRRLASIRARHEKKAKFIERIVAIQ